MNVHDVAKAGTSIWLDDLSRAKITGTDAHSLPSRIANSGVVGVTTNPSIFSGAISGAAEYSADIATMKGATVDDVVKKLTTDDVRQACDVLPQSFQAVRALTAGSVLKLTHAWPEIQKAQLLRVKNCGQLLTVQM